MEMRTSCDLGLSLCVVHDDVGGLVDQLPNLPHRHHPVQVHSGPRKSAKVGVKLKQKVVNIETVYDESKFFPIKFNVSKPDNSGGL